MLRRLEPAVALTIHRAQGSEADRVIVLWPDPLEDGPAAEHQHSGEVRKTLTVLATEASDKQQPSTRHQI